MVLVVLVDRMITVAGIHLLQLCTRNEDVCGSLDVRGLACFQSETRAEGDDQEEALCLDLVFHR